GPLLDLLLQLVDLGPLAADDDAGPRGVDVDLQLVGGALGFDLGDARVSEPLLQRGPQLEILVQQLGVVAIGVPARSPRLVEPEPESVRMNLLAHCCSFTPFSPSPPGRRRRTSGCRLPAGRLRRASGPSST